MLVCFRFESTDFWKIANIGVRFEYFCLSVRSIVDLRQKKCCTCNCLECVWWFYFYWNLYVSKSCLGLEPTPTWCCLCWNYYFPCPLSWLLSVVCFGQNQNWLLVCCFFLFVFGVVFLFSVADKLVFLVCFSIICIFSAVTEVIVF